MKCEAMDEHLLGYLLGALDPATRQRVEIYLRTHPEARSRLEQLEQALEPLAADREDPDPPPTLATRTLARVAEHQCRHLPTAPASSSRQAGAATWRWFRRIDWAVAAVLLVLVGGLLSAALAGQWRAYQRSACANNLRQIWEGLNAYADITEGAFPRVEAEGARSVAGIFVPTLREAGVLSDVSIRCPAQGSEPLPSFTLLDLERLYREQPELFRAAARSLAGSYAYTLGYRDGDELRGLERSSGDTLPILADCPPPDGRGNSLNHGGRGQNVLYVGGTVRWCALTTVGENGDDIYLNQKFQVRAGLNRCDTVLGPGDASPYRAE
jgi:hypothetical protein